MVDWADRLNEALGDSGLSKVELARRSGVNKDSVYKYLRGRVNQPRGKNTTKLADALAVIPLWLKEGTGPKRSAQPDVIATKAVDLGAKESEPLHRSIRRAPFKVQMATVSLPELALNAAAGGGAVVEAEEPVANWAIPEVWLRTITQARESDLHVITVDGNSMEPELHAGDKVIVDHSRRSPTPPGIFVLHDGIGLIVKQLEHIPKTDPPRIEIKSANKHYRTDEATAEEVTIVGRVIGVIRRV